MTRINRPADVFFTEGKTTSTSNELKKSNIKSLLSQIKAKQEDILDLDLNMVKAKDKPKPNPKPGTCSTAQYIHTKFGQCQFTGPQACPKPPPPPPQPKPNPDK